MDVKGREEEGKNGGKEGKGRKGIGSCAPTKVFKSGRLCQDELSLGNSYTPTMQTEFLLVSNSRI